MNNPDPLLTSYEAARYLGFKDCRYLDFARTRKKPGQPPYIKLGAGSRCAIRYRKSDLDKWLEAHTVRVPEAA